MDITTNSRLLSPQLPPLPKFSLSNPITLQNKRTVVSKLDYKTPMSLRTSSSQELPLNSGSTGFSSGLTPSKTLATPMSEQIPHINEIKGWNPLQKILATALDMVEKGLIQGLEKMQPLPDTANPQVQLAGNFFPVPEHAVQHELEIEGNLPKDLEGVYVRNGANPRYRPRAGHHLFDGDGMLHAVKIEQGIASYVNRFTRTHRFLEEERVGRPMFPKAIGELHGHSGIARLALFYARACLGVVKGSSGMGVANAGVTYFNGRLLAMSEDDLPYAVRITSCGDLQTLGQYDFDGQWKSSMIAHPKLDSETGQLFALTYDVLKKPYLKYFKVSKDGQKESEVTIESVTEPTLMHDFAITKNFVVIPDQQIIFKLQEMLRGGSPVLHCKEKTSRFGLLPRDAVNDHEMTWIDVPDCFCFHLWNAWEEEEGDEVVVIGSCMTPPDSIFNECIGSLRSVLSEIKLNLKTLTSHRRIISHSLNLEAGQVNRKLLGKKTQFAYLAIAQPWPKVCGIAKVNLHYPNPHPNTPHFDPPNTTMSNTTTDNSASTSTTHTTLHPNDNHMYIKSNPTNENVVASFMFPPNCFGGEPMFVPRSNDPSNPEDDGYVLTFMHNEATGRSELLILDASSPCLEMCASIKIPSRVPYGFHGTFITPEELENQKHSLNYV